MKNSDMNPYGHFIFYMLQKRIELYAKYYNLIEAVKGYKYKSLACILF